MGINVASGIPTTPNVDQAVSVNKTLATAGTAESLVTVPVGKVCRKFSLVNEGPGNAYIEIGGTATVNSVPILPKDSWVEDDVTATSFSFIGDAGKKPNVRGVIWAGF